MGDDEDILKTISSVADYPNPFWVSFDVRPCDIDGFGHVNNTVYLKWLDQTVWAHTRAVGLTEDACKKLNRGMAVSRHELDYLSAAHSGDRVVCMNWLSSNDGRLRASRTFQIVRIEDAKTLLRARTDYVCTNLKTGRPAKMPDEFRELYAATINCKGS